MSWCAFLAVERFQVVWRIPWLRDINKWCICQTTHVSDPHIIWTVTRVKQVEKYMYVLRISYVILSIMSTPSFLITRRATQRLSHFARWWRTSKYNHLRVPYNMRVAYYLRLTRLQHVAFEKKLTGIIRIDAGLVLRTRQTAFVVFK